MSQGAEQYAFQAEINQLLSLIINAFYQEKDVFLRELISNASDALDKMRIDKLAKSNTIDDLSIHIIPKPESSQLIIEDSGIGMSREDLIKNLGTIAHSGTKAFMEAMLQKSSSGGDATNLIGQFGVGFYSAFLVADTVKVFSRKNDSDETFCWSSNASGTFSVELVPQGSSDALSHYGTRIVLCMKQGNEEYLDEFRLRQVIRKHSDFCAFPIHLRVKKVEEVEEEVEETGEDASEQKEDDGEVSKEEQTPEKKTKKVQRETFVDEEINKIKPVWQRKPDDVTKEEHEAFYKSITGDWDTPIGYKHFEVEGQLQFKSVLYVPKRPPFDMFQPKKRESGIRIHVRRVFVTDNVEDLIPDWLSFVKGIVDSDDLPLNVSRETLQQTKVVKVIGKNITKKCIELFTEMAESEDKASWKTFYDSYSKNIKMGVHSDHQSRDKLMNLLRFHSTKTKDSEMTSLANYCARMKDAQKEAQKIYFMTSDNIEAALASPLIERFKKHGVEVLLMTDPIDEYVMQAIDEYSGHKFVNVAKDGLDIPKGLFPSDEAEDAKPDPSRLEALCKAIKDNLGDKVTKVQPSERLETSPCVLISETYGWTANMERIIKAQALSDNSTASSFYSSRKVMEINPKHAIVKHLIAKLDNNAGKGFKDAVSMLFDTAMLSSGFVMSNPSTYATRIFRLIHLGLEGECEEEQQDQVAAPAPEEVKEEAAEAVVSSMEDVD